MRHHVVALGFLALGCSLDAHGEAGIIDDNRLLKAQMDSGNWLSHGRDYSNQRFSSLKQINKGNVKGLALAWTFKSGVSSTFQTTPIVADGVMYLPAVQPCCCARREIGQGTVALSAQ